MSTLRRSQGAVWRRIPDGVLVRVPGPGAHAVLLTGAAAETWMSLDRSPCGADLDADAAAALLAAGLATTFD